MATIRSSRPLAVTSTPVRCGRVSSREAARATRAIVSTNAWVGTVSTPSVGASGSFGKSSWGSVRRWKRAWPDVTSTSCCALRYSSVISSFGQGAGHVQQQPARHHGLARRGRIGLEPDAQAQLHVGGLELGASLLHADQHAGEGLDGAAGGSRAHGHAKAGEERFTGNGELQDLPN